MIGHSEERKDKFEKMFVEKMEETIIGDPMNEDTELGPLAREDLLVELDEQVRKSIDAGADILTGGKRLDRKGFYYEPTILGNLKRGMPAYEEELFGPVASVIRVKNEDEAIFVANDTDFGLGASLWTNDIEKGKRLAKEINSGSVFINHYR